jgi:predicted Zn-dependent peptidase
VELLTHQIAGAPQIVILRDPSALTLSMGWFVKAGSRDESPELAGVSHFLEHMVFKGTHRRTAEQVNRELDDLGAQSNAFTSEESTVFYASVLPECQDRSLDLLTDLMQPLFDPEEFETEKQVILEEIAMYDDQPPYGAFELAMEQFFGSHPLASRVLGSVESISDMTLTQMQEYHRSRYTTDNMFLAVSGNVDVEQLIEYVANQTRQWPQAATPRKLFKPRYQTGVRTVPRDGTTQFYAISIWPGIDSNDPRRYALRLLCTILADDSGSRLFWELIDTGRAETAAIWPHLFDECGCVMGYLCCAPEDADSNQQIVARIIQQVLEDGVTERELELARSKIVSGLVLSDERPSSRLFALGQSWLCRGQYEPLDVILGRYEAVTRDDILQIARATLNQSKTQVQVIDQQSQQVATHAFDETD